MTRWFITVFVFVSVILFPWQLTAILVIGSSFFVPLVPLAVGIFADTLYYTPKVAVLPWVTILGAVVTLAALLVRNRIQASTIQK